MSDPRRRICEAMLDLVCSRGYNAVTVADLVERAEVAPEVFNLLFGSKEDCALEVIQTIQNDFRSAARKAYEGEALWPDSLRAALYTAADWIIEHPRESRFMIVEMLWVSDLAEAHRETGFPLFIEMVDAGREQAEDPDSISSLTAEGVVGSILQLATKRIRRPDFEPRELVPELMYLAVLPYLGEEVASRELEIPPPSGRRGTNEAGYRPGVNKREPCGEEPGSGLPRLPRGRHGLPREMVEENQRQRLITGVIAAVAEHGYGKTTIAQITGAAKLSRRTFYEHFSNKEDCFAAAYEASFGYIREAMLTAAAEQQEWPERVRAGLAGLLGTLAENPELATFFLIAPASVGDAIADRHHLAMRELVSGLLEGAPDGSGSAESAETREQALAGGISRLIVRKVNAGEAEELGELLPALVELVLRPILGGEVAVRVAGES